MMSAAHRLPSNHQTQGMLIMRLARVIAIDIPPSKEAESWARQAGLPETVLLGNAR